MSKQMTLEQRVLDIANKVAAERMEPCTTRHGITDTCIADVAAIAAAFDRAGTPPPTAPEINLSEAQFTALANRILEEHRKYATKLGAPHWAEIAVRKVVSEMRHMLSNGDGAQHPAIPPDPTADPLRSTCNSCKKEIVFDGRHWKHEGYSPRHPAVPNDRDARWHKALAVFNRHLARRISWDKAVQEAGATCPNCGEAHQVQLIDTMGEPGPLWRCRKCRHRFNTIKPPHAPSR